MDSLTSILVDENTATWLRWLIIFVFVIGTWKLIWFILTPFMVCLGHACRGKQNLRRKYGRTDNSAFAVVTGGSDGIGFDLCM